MSQINKDEFKAPLKDAIRNQDDKSFDSLEEQFLEQTNGNMGAWIKLCIEIGCELAAEESKDQSPESADAETAVDYTVRAVDEYLEDDAEFDVVFIKNFFDGDISDAQAKELAKELEDVVVLHKDEPDEQHIDEHNMQYFKDIIAVGDDAQKLGELFLKHYENDDIASQLQFNKEINTTRSIYAMYGDAIFDELNAVNDFCSTMQAPNLGKLKSKFEEVKPLIKKVADDGVKLFEEQIKPRSKELYDGKVKPFGNKLKDTYVSESAKIPEIFKGHVKQDEAPRKSPLFNASEMATKADEVISEHDQRVKDAAKQEYLEVLAYMINDKAERGERELVLTAIDGELPTEGLNLSPEVSVLNFYDDIVPELTEAGYTITEDKHKDAVGYIIKW